MQRKLLESISERPEMKEKRLMPAPFQSYARLVTLQTFNLLSTNRIVS